jgi:hypothetical protein
MPFCHQSVFVKRQLFLEIGFFDCRYRLAADYDWIYRAYMMKAVIKYLPLPLSNFSMNGLSNRFLSEASEEMKSIALKYVNGDAKLISEIRKAHMDRINGRDLEEKIQFATTKERDKMQQYAEMYWGGDNSIYLWGAGVRGMRFASIMNQLGIIMKGVIDSDPSRWGQLLFNVMVFDPAILKEQRGKVMITPVSLGGEIALELEKEDYQYQRDYFFMSEFVEYMSKKFLHCC